MVWCIPDIDVILCILRIPGIQGIGGIQGIWVFVGIQGIRRRDGAGPGSRYPGYSVYPKYSGPQYHDYNNASNS